MTAIYFLSKDDIKQLTGYQRPGKQVTWLKEREIPHTTDRKKYPIVRAGDVNNYFERQDRKLAS